MRAGKTAALTSLALTILWTVPAFAAPSLGGDDGWYTWRVDGTSTTLFLHQESGKPTRIRLFSPDCRISWGDSNRIEGDVNDMGTLSRDDSVALLLDIASGEDMGMSVRQEALFGLAQSNSDAAFEYLDMLVFSQ